MITRSRAWTSLRSLASAGLALAPSAFAEDGKPYSFHWSVTTDENELKCVFQGRLGPAR